MLILPFADVLACFPIVMSLEERTKSADVIFVGYVTGIHLDDFQQSLALKESSDNSVITSGGEQKTITVWVTDNLKNSAVIQYKVRPIVGICGSGDAQLKEKVILFKKDANWFVISFNQSEYQTIKQTIANSK